MQKDRKEHSDDSSKSKSENGELKEVKEEMIINLDDGISFDEYQNEKSGEDKHYHERHHNKKHHHEHHDDDIDNNHNGCKEICKHFQEDGGNFVTVQM